MRLGYHCNAFYSLVLLSVLGCVMIWVLELWCVVGCLYCSCGHLVGVLNSGAM